MPTRAEVTARSCATLAGIGGALLVGRALGIHAPPCPFRSLTGIPCPGCGITRLADALAHGHVQASVAADPAGVLLLSTIAILGAIHVATRVRRRAVPAWVGSLAITIALGTLAVAHWATTIVTGGMLRR